MERKGELHDSFLASVITTILCLLGVSGCTDRIEDGCTPTDIILDAFPEMTRAAEPDAELLSDANVFVFSEDGFLERHEFIRESSCTLPLVYGREYSIFVCANFGYKLKVKTLEELNALECHLVYPDDYSTGIPMSGKVTGVRAGKAIRISLTRLMAKISLRIDRSRLDEGVIMDVSGLRIGNCPRRAKVFSPSGVSGADECFPVGFSRGSGECGTLNRDSDDGLSPEISLYMLENLQGAFPEEIGSDSEKVFGETDWRAEVCSYVEIELEYSSADQDGGSGILKYRFYLGETRNDLNVERNCHYHITVTPSGDGLDGDGWRVDKTGLSYDRSFKMEPEGYVEAKVGETLHVRCTFSPPYAPFDIGLEELEEDRERGIYDYVIDADGKGVVLTMRGKGSGMLYMSAGEPVNQSGLLYVEVK